MTQFVDDYFIKALRLAAIETRRICLRGNQKLTALEDRIQRVGQFSTCVRRYLFKDKPQALKEECRIGWPSISHCRTDASKLIECLIDKKHWHDVLEWEPSRYGAPIFNIRRDDFSRKDKTTVVDGVTYRTIDMSDILNWISQAKQNCSSVDELNESINSGMDELREILEQSQKCVEKAETINRRSDIVLDDLASILEN